MVTTSTFVCSWGSPWPTGYWNSVNEGPRFRKWTIRLKLSCLYDSVGVTKALGNGNHRFIIGVTVKPLSYKWIFGVT